MFKWLGLKIGLLGVLFGFLGFGIGLIGYKEIGYLIINLSYFVMFAGMIIHFTKMFDQSKDTSDKSRFTKKPWE